MKKEIGLWIDRREAVLVILTEGEEEIRHIPSNSVTYTRYSGSSHARTPEGLKGDPLEDPRDRKYGDRLNKYYDAVIAAIRDADSVQIFGPGEAKGELETRIKRDKLKAHIPAIETADSMTDHQVAAKVREHFSTKSVPGDQHKKSSEPLPENCQFSTEEALSIGMQLNIDWSQVDLEQFRRGLEVELEHGAIDPQTNVTGDDFLLTGKIAWAHLKEIRDYYTRLDRMEAEAQEQFKSMPAE